MVICHADSQSYTAVNLCVLRLASQNGSPRSEQNLPDGVGDTKLADFLLPAFFTRFHLCSGLAGPSNLVAKSTRVWGALPDYDTLPLG